MTEAEAAHDRARVDRRDSGILALLGAWLLALCATFAVLFIGEVMGETPCLLCWYQRTAMFPLALVLGIAAFRGDLTVWRYALPLALIGSLLAAFHTLLFFGALQPGLEPCSEGPSCIDAHMTIFGMAIPALSLATFVLIGVCLLHVRRGDHHE